MGTWRVTRSIEFFDKETEKLAGIIPLGPTGIAELQQLFRRPDSDPMYDGYPITTKEAEYFEREHGATFNFDRYEYFLVCVRT